MLPAAETSDPAPTEDDISLLLADPSYPQQHSDRGADFATPTLRGMAWVKSFYGPSITAMFGPPDSRTPDIIVQPQVGWIYSTSGGKQAEHGGFSHDDTNVMLLVANPALQGRTLTTAVETAQVGPTILKMLGLNPNSLQAVQMEGTAVLPELNFGN